MRKSTVALIRCETYEDDTVLEAVWRGMELPEGVSAFLKPGERIVLKPNGTHESLVAGSIPAAAISTSAKQ